MNSQQIRIPIPEDLSRDSLIEYFGNLMAVLEPNHDYAYNESRGSLLKALDLDIGDRELMGDLDIEDVEVTETYVHVTFSLEISSFHGCKNLDYQKLDQRSVTGITDGSDWVFDVFQSPPERTTVDEF